MELCLGTVQIGMDYGIMGQTKPPLEDAVAWLDYATQNGITAIDTARAYGTAEEVVGAFIRKKTVPRERLFISTKMKPNLLDDHISNEYETVIERELKKQLEILGVDYVDTYVYHSARYAFDKDKLCAIHRMKEKGLARKTGVSVYEPEEAKSCFQSGIVDFIQAPYSIFDHRMKKAGTFTLAANIGCEIHTRSAFIQGLIMMDEKQVPAYLSEAKPMIRRIKKLSDEAGVSRVHLAIQYVKQEPEISHLVFGVDSLEQLKEDIAYFQEPLPKELLRQIGEEFDDMKAEIVMPSLWKK